VDHRNSYLRRCFGSGIGMSAWHRCLCAGWGSRARLLEFALAIVLAIAAVLKLERLHFGLSQAAASVIHNRVALGALVNAELLLAIWLVVGGLPRLRLALTMLFFSAMAATAGYEAARGVPNCGCFGDASAPPAVTAAFDVAAVLALQTTRKYREPVRSIGGPRLIGGFVLAALLSAGIWTASSVRPNTAVASLGRMSVPGGLVVLEPDTWRDRPFPLFDEIGGSGELKRGSWRVVFYHFDCANCVAAIPAYEALAVADVGIQTAFVAVPPLPPPGADPVPDAPGYLHLQLSPDHEWFVTTPLVIVLKDGIVRRIGDK